jgi:Sulfotransferase family
VVSVHEFAGEIPIESIHLQSHSFMTPGWLNLIGQVPSYNAYMATQNMEIAYRYVRRILKLLQWKNPHRHWVLKTPIYILSMPEVLKVFPDACFIWTHRDPAKALSSVVNTLGTLNWIRSDRPFIGGSFDQHTNAAPAAKMMSRPIDWLEAGIVPRHQLCNIQYLDFVRDPMAAVATIYRQFDIPLTDEGRRSMQRYMDEAPRSHAHLRRERVSLRALFAAIPGQHDHEVAFAGGDVDALPIRDFVAHLHLDGVHPGLNSDQLRLPT